MDISSSVIESLLSSHEDLNASEERRRAIYAAFESGDPRFDGKVYVGVKSTGIYCRTVCKARLPKYENCDFYATAAEAELAGFRPCMTCRPEIAPGLSNVDSYSNFTRRATAYFREHCTSNESLADAASKLGCSDRHLRRVFSEELHVTPQQYRKTSRLLLAKQLLMDTTAPLSQIAHVAGFNSVRTFNQAFLENYHLAPSQMRKRRGSKKVSTGSFTMSLGYRQPYRFDLILDFFRVRMLPGVENVDEASYTRTVCIFDQQGNAIYGWVKVENDPPRNALLVTMSDSLFPVVMQVLFRVRRQFDVDCNPYSIKAGIASMNEMISGSVIDGIRLPGCFDSFETACRAILGQQISVSAACKLAARIVENYGTEIDLGIDGLCFVFPSPNKILEFKNIEESFGKLGVIKTRSHVIEELAQLINAGQIDLENGNPSEVIDRLLSIKGIGPWTANYIAMRCMSYPDAFLETDVGVKHALPELTPKERITFAEKWRPWRSYATICLWNSLNDSKGDKHDLS